MNRRTRPARLSRKGSPVGSLAPLSQGANYPRGLVLPIAVVSVAGSMLQWSCGGAPPSDYDSTGGVSALSVNELGNGDAFGGAGGEGGSAHLGGAGGRGGSTGE